MVLAIGQILIWELTTIPGGMGLSPFLGCPLKSAEGLYCMLYSFLGFSLFLKSFIYFGNFHISGHFNLLGSIPFESHLHFGVVFILGFIFIFKI